MRAAENAEDLRQNLVAHFSLGGRLKMIALQNQLMMRRHFDTPNIRSKAAGDDGLLNADAASKLLSCTCSVSWSTFDMNDRFEIGLHFNWSDHLGSATVFRCLHDRKTSLTHTYVQFHLCIRTHACLCMGIYAHVWVFCGRNLFTNEVWRLLYLT